MTPKGVTTHRLGTPSLTSPLGKVTKFSIELKSRLGKASSSRPFENLLSPLNLTHLSPFEVLYGRPILPAPGHLFFRHFFAPTGSILVNGYGNELSSSPQPLSPLRRDTALQILEDLPVLPGRGIPPHPGPQMDRTPQNYSPDPDSH